jgi:septal ring factor EnvC (AmiA/AmiB activator)
MAKQTLEARVSQHDREIAAIRKLILAGMKLIVENQKDVKEARAEMKELRAMQKKTEATLDRFIRSMERGSGNGHTKRDVH